MVRVLEQRCRDAEGQAGLAEEGRRRFEQLFHQQQVQTDINAQGRQQSEDATSRSAAIWRERPQSSSTLAAPMQKR